VVVTGGSEVDVVVDVTSVVVVLVLVVEVVVVDVGMVVVDEGVGAQDENSEVFPWASVAVAVRYSVDGSTVRGSGALKAACPEGSVTTSSSARRSPPSPWRLGSQPAAAKISMAKLAFGTLSSVPDTESPPEKVGSSTGKFCWPFAPVSRSPASFGVTP